jgi:hypothetical protein
MMKNNNLTIAEQLHVARAAINNALNTDYILAALTPFGYDAARLQAAQALLDEVQTAVAHHDVAYGEQYQATADLKAARRNANRVYMTAVKIARLAFQHNVQARATLRLAGRRAQSFAGWLEQATVFYQNLLDHPTLLAAMAPFGYNAARLAEELALVRAAEAANQRQEAAKGAAQAATQARDEKLRQLQEWMSDFRVIAPIALADNMQALETLRLRVVP